MGVQMFEGQRLLLARQRRGLNKTKLAKLVGVTPQMVTYYESERTTPSSDVVDRIVSALRFPADFFHAEMPDAVPLDAASFRSLSRMTASQRDAALAGGTLCIALNDWIEAKYHLPEPDVPDLDPGILDPSGAAAHVRAAWGLGDAPIKNVLHLLEAHGVRVYALTEECKEVDAFSFWREEANTPFICVGTHKTPERTVFDLAHELGHLVMHRDHSAPRGRDEEQQADAFASSFLMPRSDVLAVAPRFPTLQDLAEAKGRWRVSAAALNYRMHRLGLITDWHYRSLCIEISRLGRNKELKPIAREQSQILTKVLAGLRSEGISRADIARALHLHPADLDALFGGLVVTMVDGDGERTTPAARPNLRLV